MAELPLLSIIVPVYRVEPYLDRCIQSLVEQTYTNLEIILVDDGSPDQCGAICETWAARDHRIKVIHQENGGAGKARNTALDMASGEFIGMVDSDDYIAPQMYEHLLGLMDENTDLTECAVTDTDNDHCELDDGSVCEIVTATAAEAMALHLQETMFCQTPPNKLYRRSIIGDIRFPVGNLIDDEFFTYRVLGRARRLVHSSARMYAYRQQPGSVMHKPYSLRRLQGLKAQKERLEYLKQHMPELSYRAEVNLFFACVYARQMSLKWLPEPEQTQARAVIRETLAGVTPLAPRKENGLKKNIWLLLGQISFDGLCKFQNFLESRDR